MTISEGTISRVNRDAPVSILSTYLTYLYVILWLRGRCYSANQRFSGMTRGTQTSTRIISKDLQ